MFSSIDGDFLLGGQTDGDSVARNNRPITEQEAFILSDKIIRANWFESYTH